MKKNFKFLKHQNSVGLARMTPIATVSDEQIWVNLVTPLVRGFLGDFVAPGECRILETIEGLFPGDEVSNLNDHRLYGGQTGFVRFPYEHHFYPTERGAFIVKRDGVKFEAFAWFGNVLKGPGELTFKAALRDRQHDGTIQANDTALVDYPYDDPVLNKRLPVKANCLELSIYGFIPRSRCVQADGNAAEYDLFVEKPYPFRDRPELFLKYLDSVWKSDRAPGQNAAPIFDVSQFVPPGFERLARSKGYDFIEVAPSHYHVAMWAQSQGYRFTDLEQARTMAQFAAGMKRIRAAGIKLTRQQESWVCVIQSLPPQFIPAHLNCHGPVWPQDNVGPQNLWMNKPLNEKARLMLP